MTRVLHVQKVTSVHGSETHLLSLLPLLRARGWDARMLVLDEGEEGAADFVRRLEALEVPVRRLRMRLDADPVAFARLLGVIRAARPEIVHTHLFHGDVYGQAAAAALRVPVRASTKHGFDEFRANRAVALADRAAARLAHVHVAISRGLAEYLAETEGFDADAFDVVHYGIALGPEPPPPPAEPRLLCIGRLIPIKGHDTLLRAFARARGHVPGLTLDLAGEGALEEGLRALAAELGVADAVRFLGYVSPVAPLVERSLAVVVPSLGEGFGLVALEAMERGRAVVASRVGGLGEIVADGVTGRLVPPGEVEPLADALAAVASEPEAAAALGAAGRERAAREFAEERCAERTAELYERALARRRRT